MLILRDGMGIEFAVPNYDWNITNSSFTAFCRGVDKLKLEDILKGNNNRAGTDHPSCTYSVRLLIETPHVKIEIPRFRWYEWDDRSGSCYFSGSIN